MAKSGTGNTAVTRRNLAFQTEKKSCFFQEAVTVPFLSKKETITKRLSGSCDIVKHDTLSSRTSQPFMKPQVQCSVVLIL